MTASPHIRHITFIGSEEVGRKVAMAATTVGGQSKFCRTLLMISQHLTPVTLELGGKDPAIILPDTDLNLWINTWMRGTLCVRHLTIACHS